MKIKTKPNPQKALQLLRKLQEKGLGDSFGGLSEEKILRKLKETREKLWQQKIVSRP